VQQADIQRDSRFRDREIKLADCNMIALFDVGADIDTQRAVHACSDQRHRQPLANQTRASAASSALIDDDIAAGRLVMPLRGPKLPAEGYCAYLPKAKLNDPTVMTFCEWLQRIGSQSLTRRKEKFLAGDAI
jgi:DNA-binding transcriptional LysR family regulator